MTTRACVWKSGSLTAESCTFALAVVRVGEFFWRNRRQTNNAFEAVSRCGHRIIPPDLSFIYFALGPLVKFLASSKLNTTLRTRPVTACSPRCKIHRWPDSLVQPDENYL